MPPPSSCATPLGAGGPQSIAVLGGARGTNEDAFAWAALADAIGTPHRDAQLGDGLPAAVLGLPRATIEETTRAATVVLLAPDLKEELPVLFLRLRHAAEQRKVKIIEIGPADTGLTRHAWRSIRVEAGATGALQSALADHEIVDQLRAGPVVVVAGRANLAESTAAAATALKTVLDACPGAQRPAGAAARQRRRRRAARSHPAGRTGSTPPASSRPLPTVASTSSSCSVPTRSTTSRTPTSPAAPSPVPAASSASTRS